MSHFLFEINVFLTLFGDYGKISRLGTLPISLSYPVTNPTGTHSERLDLCLY